MYNGIIKKSRTMDYAVLVAVFGAVLQALPLLQEQLSGNYGYVFMGISVGVAILRVVTTTPLGEKE